MSSAVLNSIGLALDVAGVVLIYFFGGLHGAIMWDGQQVGTYRTKVLSHVGFALLVTGFLVQIASNHLDVLACLWHGVR